MRGGLQQARSEAMQWSYLFIFIPLYKCCGERRDYGRQTPIWASCGLGSRQKQIQSLKCDYQTWCVVTKAPWIWVSEKVSSNSVAFVPLTHSFTNTCPLVSPSSLVLVSFHPVTEISCRNLNVVSLYTSFSNLKGLFSKTVSIDTTPSRKSIDGRKFERMPHC